MIVGDDRVKSGRWIWVVRARVALAIVLALAIIAGVAGQVVRDRSVAWAILMYFPLVPLGMLAAAFDLSTRGRALPIGRFALGGIGLAGAVLGAASLIVIGPGGATLDHAGRDEVSVLHWNVIWGGGRARNPAGWEKIRRTILDRDADIVVLSEAAPDEWLDGLVQAMGPGASRVQVENGPEAVSGFWFKLVVASRWPVRKLAPAEVANGAAMAAEVVVRGLPVRVLVVDGQSHPLTPRGPFLADVARLCRAAKEAGEPFDVVAGDFNSVSRSRGFDALSEMGYDLAARSARGWRGTFPSFAPLYDIDHVWVRNDAEDLRCGFFTNLASDHRGQVVRFRLPGSPRLAVQFQDAVLAHLLGLGAEPHAGRFEVGGQ